MKRIIVYFLLSAFLLASCDESDWSPGPQEPSSVLGVYFDMERSSASAQLGDGETSFTITLGRDGSRAAEPLVFPIIVEHADEGLSIPQSVTFAAGATSATLRIDITLADWEHLKYRLKVDPNQFGDYTLGSYSFAGEVFFDMGPVTAENISRYKLS